MIAIRRLQGPNGNDEQASGQAKERVGLPATSCKLETTRTSQATRIREGGQEGVCKISGKISYFTSGAHSLPMFHLFDRLIRFASVVAVVVAVAVVPN